MNTKIRVIILAAFVVICAIILTIYLVTTRAEEPAFEEGYYDENGDYIVGEPIIEIPQDEIIEDYEPPLPDDYGDAPNNDGLPDAPKAPSKPEWSEVWYDFAGFNPEQFVYPKGVTDLYLDRGGVGKRLYIHSEEELTAFLSDITIKGIADSCANSGMYYISCEVETEVSAPSTLLFTLNGSTMVKAQIKYGNDGAYMGHFADMYERLRMREFNVDSFMSYLIELNDYGPIVVFKDDKGLEFVMFPYGPEELSQQSDYLYDTESFVRLLRDNKEQLFNLVLATGDM